MRFFVWCVNNFEDWSYIYVYSVNNAYLLQLDCHHWKHMILWKKLELWGDVAILIFTLANSFDSPFLDIEIHDPGNCFFLLIFNVCIYLELLRPQGLLGLGLYQLFLFTSDLKSWESFLERSSAFFYIRFNQYLNLLIESIKHMKTFWSHCLSNFLTAKCRFLNGS